MKFANKDNFYINSEANFEFCEKPNREPDYISASGSEYWYTEEGVFRNSDHWGNGIASCDWQLLNCNEWDIPQYQLTYKPLCGFAKWQNFKLKEFFIITYVENEKNIDFKIMHKYQKNVCFADENDNPYNKLVWKCDALFYPSFSDLDDNNKFALPNGKKISITSYSCKYDF